MILLATELFPLADPPAMPITNASCRASPSTLNQGGRPAVSIAMKVGLQCDEHVSSSQLLHARTHAHTHARTRIGGPPPLEHAAPESGGARRDLGWVVVVGGESTVTPPSLSLPYTTTVHTTPPDHHHGESTHRLCHTCPMCGHVLPGPIGSTAA